MANMGTIPHPIEQLVFAQEMVKLQQVTPVTSWKCFDLSSILKQLESFVLLTTPLRAEPQYYLKTKLTSHMTLSRSLFPSQRSSNFIKSGRSVVKRTDFRNVTSFLFAAHTAHSPVDFFGRHKCITFLSVQKGLYLTRLPSSAITKRALGKILVVSPTCILTPSKLNLMDVSTAVALKRRFLKASDNLKSFWHI